MASGVHCKSEGEWGAHPNRVDPLVFVVASVGMNEKDEAI
jgi:hypothetical protein